MRVFRKLLKKIRGPNSGTIQGLNSTSGLASAGQRVDFNGGRFFLSLGDRTKNP